MIWFPPQPNPCLSACLGWNPAVASIPSEIWPTAALATKSREAKGGQGGILRLRYAILILMVVSDLMLKIGFVAQK
jgi:hypothetical protein